MVTRSRPGGRVVCYVADLKGDVLKKTTKDWRRVTVEDKLPEGVDHVELDFIGQGVRRVGLGKKPRD